MMGFTFIIGIAFAYVLKLMIFTFSNFSEKGFAAFTGQVKDWTHNYSDNLRHTYESIWATMRPDDKVMRVMPLDTETKDETIYGMNGMAEYHFGNLADPAANAPQLNVNYELHHGKI